ncbi:MAG: immunity 53 family protein [Thioalkalivibrio sp.]|nr:immunity 53 family protein [Thioalkalivibrio sp.]
MKVLRGGPAPLTLVSLGADLEGTELEHRTFDEVRVRTSPINWAHCRVSDNRFEGFGGPLNLDELLHVFNTWASGGASPRA